MRAGLVVSLTRVIQTQMTGFVVRACRRLQRLKAQREPKSAQQQTASGKVAAAADSCATCWNYSLPLRVGVGIPLLLGACAVLCVLLAASSSSAAHSMCSLPLACSVAAGGGLHAAVYRRQIHALGTAASTLANVLSGKSIMYDRLLLRTAGIRAGTRCPSRKSSTRWTRSSSTAQK